MNTWMEQAACREADPTIFDPDVTADDTDAKLYCFDCPVRDDCLQHALVRNEVGIWGGTNDARRKSLRRKLGIRVVRWELPVSCGTAAGARTHQRRGEALCRSCADAQRVHSSARPGYGKWAAS